VKVLVGLVGVVITGVLGIAVVAGGPSGASPAAATGVDDIPPSLRTIYLGAADTCPGLPWQVLAAIGFTESRHAQGRADPHTGDVNPPIVGPAVSTSSGVIHALGPMQFLPTTWTTWRRLAPGRPPDAQPSVQNAWDAIYTAAAYLCDGRPRLDDLPEAILSYNPSPSYVAAVMSKATEYGLGSDTPSDLGARAVAAALRVLGVPYVYGAESPTGGFDCSGLVQWAYAQVGVQLPRVTYDQVRIGVPAAVSELRAGDLIFSRGDVPVRDFGHVAMYVGNGIEVVAPHTGTVVQLRPIDPPAIEAIRRVA
jgi:cell wall-associated NlpC family hydrolase